MIASGPVGIGKTIAVDEFRRRNPGDVVKMTLGKANASGPFVLRELCRALHQEMIYEGGYFVPATHYECRNHIINTIANRNGLSARKCHELQYPQDAFSPLTVIVDEAQNCGPQALETLRFFNDPSCGYSPVSLGFVIIGNARFSLRPTDDGSSPVTRAVGDRALYNQAFTYASVTDDDLLLVADNRYELDEECHTLILSAFSPAGLPRGGQITRSLRTLGDALDGAAFRGGGRVTAENLRRSFDDANRFGKFCVD